MDIPSLKQLMMEFLLDLLNEERQKRKEAEQEVETLRAILKPLQQKEMDHIKARREESIEKELGAYVRSAFPRRGRIVCDCDNHDKMVGHDESASYDEVESKSV